jgi:methylmalonyl-CoA/ethylmalonyl-CoA epimerase
MGRLPMPSIRLDHIAIALPRIADAPSVLVAVLGGVPERIRPAGVFRWASWTYAGGGRIEVLEPLGADGFVHRFLAAHGPGVHHVTFKVPDLDAICRRAERHGYGLVGRDESDPSWKEAFFHPKQALGIVVQLAEAGTPAPPGAPGDLPPGLPDAPPPARILGLRMRAHSRERALTQWRDILQAEVNDGPGGGLTFRWPASPMRILVDVDPAAAEGPLAIELASERGLAGLEEAGARLGIRLVPRPGT